LALTGLERLEERSKAMFIDFSCYSSGIFKNFLLL